MESLLVLSDLCSAKNVSFCILVRGFETEEQFEAFVKTDPHSSNILAAVVFEHRFSHDDEPLPLQVRSHYNNLSDYNINIFHKSYGEISPKKAP